jgi:uncharacterized membrane protein YagU involved in acid resistance
MNFFKPAVFGAVAGLSATFLMTKFQESAQKLEKALSEKRKNEEKGTPSTVKLADKVSQTIVHHRIPARKKDLAGNFVHYGFGTSLGILYGILNQRKMPKEVFSGLAFGFLVWALADNGLVPLMKLSQGPFEKGWKDQAYALAAHLMYGGVLGNVLRSEKEIIL